MRIRTLAVSAATALAISATGVVAQMSDTQMPGDMMPDRAGTIDFDASAGATLPADELADYTDVGANLGLGASYWLTDHVALRVNGDVDLLPGATELPGTSAPLQTRLPDMRLWHYGGSLEVDPLMRSRANPWMLTVSAGAGATTIDTDEFSVEDEPEGSFTATYVGMNGGVQVGYALTDNIELGVRGRAIVSFVDESETTRLADLSTALSPLDNALTFPLTAIVQIDTR